MKIRHCVAAFLGLAALTLQAQRPLVAGATQSRPEQPAVSFLFPEQITVAARKPTPVALHFRVAPGLHINSHTPKDEFLIPTTFSIPEGSGVRLVKAVYPPGTEATLPVDPGTMLSVYSGEFVVQARIVAEAGGRLVEAKLRYQACDNKACLPPKTLTVAIDVVGE
jgi:hypothetical protein